MPLLKVCGITDPAFAVEAARRGIDYLGLIFAAKSPRRVTLECAREIVQTCKGGNGMAGRPCPSPRFVGVFVEQSVDEILAMSGTVPIGVIQLHRDCDADEISRLKSAGYEVWTLHRLGTVPNAAEAIAQSDAVLLDGRDGARCGGTGKRADWSLVPELKREGRRVVLAGGLTPENIADAAATGADILDVNSGVEIAPGVKSIQLLDRLLSAIKSGRQTT